jgi:rod shape-determining protein MreC
MVRRHTLSLLAVICLGHVLLISAQVQSKSGLPVIEVLAFDVFARVQGLTSAVADAGHSSWTNYFALRGAAKENDTLRQEVVKLQVQLEQQQAIAARTHTLEDTLHLKESQPAPTLAARVIAGNPSPGSLTITIDRGSADGVGPDLAVIGAGGVVGRVIDPVAPHAATVQLIIGRSAGAGVTFERSKAGGLVIGGAVDPPLRAQYVPETAEVQAGERVTTSGQDGIYPEGFLVGTVEHVTRSTGADREITIRPAVDFSHIDMVLVVLARAPRSEPAKP